MSRAGTVDTDILTATLAQNAPPPDSVLLNRLNPSTLGWAAVAIAILALLFLLGPILTPFFLAGIIAYICQPLVAALERRRVPRVLGVILVMLLITAIVGLLILIVLPLFIKEILLLTKEVPNWLEKLNTTIAPWINQRFGTAIRLDPASIRDAITEALQTSEGLGMKLLASLRMGGMGLLGLFTNLILVPVVLFFLLRDWPILVSRLDQLIPRPLRPRVTEFLREADEALGQYLHGQILVIVAMCAFYTIGLRIAGLEFWLPIGILTGMLVFVPYVGAATGFVLATLAALMQFDEFSRVIWVWVVFGSGQALEGNFVTPKLVGERIGLHPIAVIFALLAFGQLFGFAGLLIALPASAVLLVALRKLRDAYLASDVYQGTK